MKGKISVMCYATWINFRNYRFVLSLIGDLFLESLLHSLNFFYSDRKFLKKLSCTYVIITGYNKKLIRTIFNFNKFLKI